MTQRTKASVDVAGVGGVAAGVGGVAAGAGGTEAVAAGVDVVALVSVTGTAVDLWLLDTLVKASIVDLPFFSSASSWSCSTAI